MIIVAVQHVVTPLALGANLLWMCPLVFIAIYMAGTGVGSIVAGISTLVMLLAEVVKATRPAAFDEFTDVDIFFFEILTIILASTVTLIIGLRVAKEERSAFSRLREQSRALRDRKNENENLVYLLSHDIANPLQIILSKSEDMAESIAESRATQTSLAEHLRQIDEATCRISDVITQVRAYKALDSGKLSVPLDSIDLVHAVEACLAQHQTAIDAKHCRLSWTSTLTPIGRSPFSPMDLTDRLCPRQPVLGVKFLTPIDHSTGVAKGRWASRSVDRGPGRGHTG